MIYVLVEVVRNLRNVMGKMNKSLKLGITLVALLVVILFVSYIFNRLTFEENIQTNTSEELTQKGVKLQKLSGDRWVTIYDNLEYRPFLLVGDYLITGSLQYNPSVHVSAYNLKTSVETVLYDEMTKGQMYVSQIYQIGDAVFFSISGYWSSESMYYVDLPIEQNKIQKIEGSSGGNIKEIEGNYWLWDGGGDSCISYGSYSLFDPKNKKVIPIAKYGSDCGIGNSLVILTDKVLKLYFTSDGNGSSLSSTTYSHVTVIDINAPKKEVDLISKIDMPPFIYDFVYDKQNNLLLLTGKEKYVFNIDNKTLIKKDFVQPDDSNQNQRTYMENTSSNLKSIKLPNGYKLDFSDSNWNL